MFGVPNHYKKLRAGDELRFKTAERGRFEHSGFVSRPPVVEFAVGF